MATYLLPIQLIHSRGALLMIWVTIAALTYWCLTPTSEEISLTSLTDKQSQVTLFIILGFQTFTPLFGWLADAWIGRYKAIVTGLLIMVLGSIVLTLATLISHLSSLIHLYTGLSYISSVINSLGVATVLANMVPFITDQMIGASATELSTAIHWYIWATKVPDVIAYFTRCMLKIESQAITEIILSFTGLTLALSSLFLGQNWLNTTHQITNPIKDIVKVISYAKNNKYPSNRSALTYWEEEAPTGLDLGKDKYGGPFTEEKVETVKTALRLILLIIFTAMQGTSFHVTSLQQRHMSLSHTKHQINCLFQGQECLTEHVSFIGIPLYHFLIRPLLKSLRLLNKCSISLLKLIGLGIVFEIIGNLGMITLEYVGHLKSPNATCMFNATINEEVTLSYYWTMIPLIVRSIGSLTISYTTFEFIIAQSPQEMKGLLLGLSYAFNGVAKLIGYNIHRLFQFNLSPGCGFYYYLTQLVILSIILTGFSILAKWYKLRIRENNINFHLIAENHTIAYIDQEERNKREEEQYIIQSVSQNNIFHYYRQVSTSQLYQEI